MAIPACIIDDDPHNDPRPCSRQHVLLAYACEVAWARVIGVFTVGDGRGRDR